MFRFDDPIYLWLLLVILVLVLLRLWMWRRQKKNWKRLGDPDLLRQLSPDVSRVRRLLKFTLVLTALALIILMLARPQMGTRVSHEKRNGIECVIALDISNSMLAQDVVPSRLDKSKMLVENLVDHFTNDRIGLVVFAGDAFVQLPITSDYVSAKMFLQNISPDLIQTQGTDIARALRVSMSSFTQQDRIGGPSSSSPMVRITRAMPKRLPKRLPRRASTSLSWVWVAPRVLLFPWAMEVICRMVQARRS